MHFVIKNPQKSEVAIDPRSGKGSARFTVTNQTNEELRARFRIVPVSGCEASWFTIDDTERGFDAGAFESYDVQVQVPSGAPAGQACSFRAEVATARNPDDEKWIGEPVRFKTPPPADEPAPTPLPWPKIGAAIAAVLLVLLAGWWWQTRSDDGIALARFGSCASDRLADAMVDVDGKTCTAFGGEDKGPWTGCKVSVCRRGSDRVGISAAGQCPQAGTESAPHRFARMKMPRRDCKAVGGADLSFGEGSGEILCAVELCEAGPYFATGVGRCPAGQRAAHAAVQAFGADCRGLGGTQEGQTADGVMSACYLDWCGAPIPTTKTECDAKGKLVWNGYNCQPRSKRCSAEGELRCTEHQGHWYIRVGGPGPGQPDSQCIAANLVLTPNPVVPGTVAGMAANGPHLSCMRARTQAGCESLIRAIGCEPAPPPAA